MIPCRSGKKGRSPRIR